MRIVSVHQRRILEVGISGTVGTTRMGPVSTVICQLSNNFAKSGQEVIVADLRTGASRPLLQPKIRLLEIPAAPWNRLPSNGRSNVYALLHRWLGFYRYVRALDAQFDFRDTDIVHAHSAEIAFLLQKLFKISVAYTAHTPLWSLKACKSPLEESVRPSYAGRLNAALHEWIERDAVRNSALTVGLGDYLRDALSATNVTTIPNGLDLDTWCPFDKTSSRQDLEIDPGDFVVLFVGRIAPIKGVDILVESVRAIARTTPKLKVHIIGALSGSFDLRDARVNSYAQSVMEASRELPIKFLGFINNCDKRFKQHLAAADVTVVPSRCEPQGLVVLESLAMGTPVIGSRTGGIPEMVSKNVGYVFPAGDSVALASCIRNAYENPQELHAKHLAARPHVMSTYSWKSIADRYLNAFRPILNPSPTVSPALG